MDEPIPDVEFVSPFSSEFLAHLDAGCYDDQLGIDVVWQRVMDDQLASEFIYVINQVKQSLKRTRFDRVM